MKIRKYVSLVVMTLLLLGTVSTFGLSEGQEDEWEVKIEEGTTDILGGGDYRFFKFGSDQTGVDARFGVLWGTDEDPNSIVLLTTQSRYIGIADVYEEEGKQVEDDKPVKFQSLLAVKIGRMFEYNDINGDGMCDFVLDENGDIEEFEQVFKYVDLTEASWEASKLQEEKEGDNTSWEFTLSASDLPYYDPQYLPQNEPYPGYEDEKLDYINFTFHLKSGIKEIDGVEIPKFNVTLGTRFGNRSYVKDVDKEGFYEAKGVIGTYEMKWDHEILGWDFEPQPQNANPSLVMGYRNIFGNHIPKGAAQWLRLNFMKQVNEGVKAQFKDEKGDHRTNLTTPSERRARLLRQNRISYGGDWSRVGRFHWLSNVTVDGEDKKMHSQIIGGYRMNFFGFVGRNFRGFKIHGGLNYPGGNRIYHDPGLSGSSYLDMASGSEPEEEAPIGSAFIFAMIATTGILITIDHLCKKRDR